MRSRLIRRLRAVSVAVLMTSVVATGAASPTDAADPTVTMTLSVAPNPAAFMSSIVLTGTVAPSSGSPQNVRVHMEQTDGVWNGGTCTPVEVCSVGASWVEWSLPSVTSKITVTFETGAQPGATWRFYDDTDGVGCTGTCPPSVKLGVPHVVASATYTPTTPVIAGTTLHITPKAVSNVDSLSGYMIVSVPSGVDPPTNLPPGAVWNPVGSQVEMFQTLTPSGEFTFDVLVNAPNGSTLTFHPFFIDSAPGSTESSQPLAIKVGPDSTPPVTTPPTQSFATNTALSSGRLPVRLAWTGSDAFSGVDRYELRQQTDGGAWAAPVSMGAVTATYRYLRHGHTYRFGVRAIDRAGNVSVWKYGSTFRLDGYSESSAANRYAGTWTLSSSATAYWGGKAKSSSRVGAQLSRSFTGRTIAWLGLRGPTRGKARVYINGTLVATVDLYASTNQPQRIVFTRTWSTSATRSIVVRVVGTAGRPRVDIDGLFVIR